MPTSCELIKPSILHEKEIIAYKQEMLDANSSVDGTGPLVRMSSIAQWLDFNKKQENKDTVSENLVVSEQFIYVRQSDGKIVGMIHFRHYFNDFLREYGGHIGYSVRPGERRKGYAKQMLADCLKVCKAQGLEDVMISCKQGNEGSKRTILANGGVYDRTVYCDRDNVYLERYWIHI